MTPTVTVVPPLMWICLIKFIWLPILLIYMYLYGHTFKKKTPELIMFDIEY